MMSALSLWSRQVAKIIYRSLKTGRIRAARSVGKKRIPNAKGGWKTVHTLDANSSTFNEDLRYVFQKNVAKARRENRRVVGSADNAPRKR
jgi:hypothetical protein